MRRIVSLIAAIMAFCIAVMAEDHKKNEAMCSKADNIIGDYYIVDEDGTSNAKIFKHTDGTYRCQTVGGKPVYEGGKLVLDKNNPDPSLRNIPIHQSIIISGLKYNAAKKQWDGGTIHHPMNSMLKASCTVDFVDDGKTMRVRGHVGPFGQNRFWKKTK